MKAIILIIISTLVISGFSTTAFSQEEKNNEFVKFTVGTDLVSRFVWRGTQLGGTSPCIQPNISLGLGNFELGAFGSYSIGGENQDQEFDIYASYTFLDDMLTISVEDYYSPRENRDYEYFDFDQITTDHVFESSVSFNGSEHIPFTFLAGVLFYGADAIQLNENPNSPNFNERIGIQYSNYFEFGYNLEISKITFNPFLGITLNNPTEEDHPDGFDGETGYYGTGPGIVNFGFNALKEIPISDKFSLPLSVSLITNPQAEKVFLVVGFTF